MYVGFSICMMTHMHTENPTCTRACLNAIVRVGMHACVHASTRALSLSHTHIHTRGGGTWQSERDVLVHASHLRHLFPGDEDVAKARSTHVGHVQEQVKQVVCCVGFRFCDCMLCRV